MRDERAVRWLVLLFVACGGSDSSMPDAAQEIDAAATCTMAGQCPCFSNYDCAPTHTCKSQGTTVSCLPGARGTGTPGSTCTGEQDCASALCVEDANGGMRCSDLCRTAETCPATLPRCVSLGSEGICAREPPSQ